MAFHTTVAECQDKLRAVDYGHEPSASDLRPYACIDLLAVMRQLVEKVKRSGHPRAPRRCLMATLGEELAKRTRPNRPNTQYICEGEDISLDLQK